VQVKVNDAYDLAHDGYKYTIELVQIE